MKRQKKEIRDIYDAIDEMKQRWTSTVIARSAVGEFSGGLISPRTLANLDSQGKGPPGKFNWGRKAAYPVNEFCEWLKGRIESDGMLES
jgi:hypothetical protein